MKTARFKTNAKCGGCVARIGEALNKIVPAESWSIDLSTPERILTVTSDLSDGEIVRTVEQAGYKGGGEAHPSLGTISSTEMA